jgi:hypothetical protein
MNVEKGDMELGIVKAAVDGESKAVLEHVDVIVSVGRREASLQSSVNTLD